jgi:hypothetical protein
MIGNVKKWLGLVGGGIDALEYSEPGARARNSGGFTYVSPQDAAAKRLAKAKRKSQKKARRRNRR